MLWNILSFERSYSNKYQSRDTFYYGGGIWSIFTTVKYRVAKFKIWLGAKRFVNNEARWMAVRWMTILKNSTILFIIEITKLSNVAGQCVWSWKARLYVAKWWYFFDQTFCVFFVISSVVLGHLRIFPLISNTMQ